jgi:hypothetical protein
LESLPAVEAVRSNPQWYFPSASFDVDLLLGMLGSEASSHGCPDFLMSRAERWWVVASSHDWLRDAPGVFEAPTPDPARGDNIAHAEVVLTAFCPRVVTVSSGIVSDIVGTDAPPEHVQSLLDDRAFARVIAFLPPPTPGDTPAEASPRNLQLVGEQVVGEPDPAAFEAAFEHFRRKELAYLAPDGSS